MRLRVWFYIYAYRTRTCAFTTARLPARSRTVRTFHIGCTALYARSFWFPYPPAYSTWFYSYGCSAAYGSSYRSTLYPSLTGWLQHVHGCCLDFRYARTHAFTLGCPATVIRTFATATRLRSGYATTPPLDRFAVAFAVHTRFTPYVYDAHATFTGLVYRICRFALPTLPFGFHLGCAPHCGCARTFGPAHLPAPILRLRAHARTYTVAFNTYVCTPVAGSGLVLRCTAHHHAYTPRFYLYTHAHPRCRHHRLPVHRYHTTRFGSPAHRYYARTRLPLPFTVGLPPPAVVYGSLLRFGCRTVYVAYSSTYTGSTRLRLRAFCRYAHRITATLVTVLPSRHIPAHLQLPRLHGWFLPALPRMNTRLYTRWLHGLLPLPFALCHTTFRYPHTCPVPHVWFSSVPFADYGYLAYRGITTLRFAHATFCTLRLPGSARFGYGYRFTHWFGSAPFVHTVVPFTGSCLARLVAFTHTRVTAHTYAFTPYLPLPFPHRALPAFWLLRLFCRVHSFGSLPYGFLLIRLPRSPTHPAVLPTTCIAFAVGFCRFYGSTGSAVLCGCCTTGPHLPLPVATRFYLVALPRWFISCSLPAYRSAFSSGYLPCRFQFLHWITHRLLHVLYHCL